ncbi:transcriptional regulator, TetR family [Haloechinothrix alba]|uniref:Transcriptional regulator, TetR family n=1 Tax=Haloechinothrix alba TaxID=664784 RepID=A0A238W737_9PSEU|nr:TetR/AcrR family transcriptional regulator [Haloechinothrix alba]SNR42370.1 transcriptional regulator, TetR family [Haloechinothrix alba]
MSTPWLRTERTELAAERILDAAEQVFAERGVAATEMSHIATAAGCSRATLYRYFDGRHEVRVAFMHRQTRRLAHRIAEQVSAITDPAPRLAEAIRGALREVRDTPALAAWFTHPDSGVTGELAGSSPVIQSLCAAFFGDPTDPANQDRANWLLRIIISLLSNPGRDEAEERRMIERFAVPALLGDGHGALRGDR